MKKKMRPILSPVLSLVILIAIGVYLASTREKLSALNLEAPVYLIKGAFAYLGAFLLNGAIYYTILRQLGFSVPMRECQKISVISSALNSLIPLQGGTAARAVYLRARYGVTYDLFLSTLIGSHVLRLLFCSAIFFVQAVMLWNLHAGRSILAAAGLGIAVVGGAFLFPTLLRLPIASRFDKLRLLSEGWERITASPRFLIGLAGLVGVELFAEIVVLRSAYLSLGIPLSWNHSLLLGASATLVSLVAITPGALGLYEGTLAAVGFAISVPPATSVAASLINRALLLFLLLPIAPLAIAFLRQTGKTDISDARGAGPRPAKRRGAL